MGAGTGEGRGSVGTEKLSQLLCVWGGGGLTARKGWRNLGAEGQGLG